MRSYNFIWVFTIVIFLSYQDLIAQQSPLIRIQESDTLYETHKAQTQSKETPSQWNKMHISFKIDSPSPYFLLILSYQPQSK